LAFALLAACAWISMKVIYRALAKIYRNPNSITCSECGHKHLEPNLKRQHKPEYRDGKITLHCLNCSHSLRTRYYCGSCGHWSPSRTSLERYPNRSSSLARYACPHCDGLITKGNILETRQGLHC
jgi:transcription elongation factor Elf1